MLQNLGFLALAGDAKVQLTPKWSPLPAPTSSLLAVASRHGIVVAAGPDAIYISSTDSVRNAFQAEKDGDTEIRPFNAQNKISMPMRISHLAFTPDEQYLILSAEQGGGLAVYETQSLLSSQLQSSFEISTSGEAVKFLAPNPMPELAEFCAVVTKNGNFLMANLREKSLTDGPNGPVIRSQVTSVSWSSKGKQLVAGLADGSIAQMTPTGKDTASIPKPDGLGDFHVASLTWLQNNLFLAFYHENTGSPPNTESFVISRNAPKGETPTFEFRKFSDPVMSFGDDSAPHHSILRIHDYPPNIQELLIVASSLSDGIGMLTKANAPLASDKAAETITEVFTTTEFTDDSRRALLPSDEDYNDSHPVGLALDLSSKDKVHKPIPSDEEIESSPGPLPAIWALNNNGVLAAWWIVYDDAIRGNTTYPGMAILQGEPPVQPAAPAPAPSPFASQQPSTPSGIPSAFANAAPALTPAAGTSSAFGGAAASSKPAFGAPSFGAPSFGTPSMGSKPAAPAFGHSGLGARASPWASGSAGTPPAFGSHGFSSPAAPAAGASTAGKVFGSGVASSGPSSGGGFAGFAGKTNFASLGAANTGESIFSKPATNGPFGANSSGQSVFGASGQSAFGQPSPNTTFGSKEVSMGNDTAFPASGSAPKQQPAFGSSPFVLGTTFKSDPASANDNEKPSGNGGFGLGGFGLSLDDAASKPADSSESKDDNVETSTPAEEKPKPVFGASQESTTPTSTPAPSKFFSADTSMSKPNPFAAPAAPSNPFASTGAKPSEAKSNPFSFDGANQAKPTSSPFGSSLTSKPNPFSTASTANQSNTVEEPEATPLPPDALSKTAYPFGDSSASSVVTAKSVEDLKKAAQPEAPLPPDSIPSKQQKDEAPPPLPEELPKPEEAPLPPDFVIKPKTESRPSIFGSNRVPEVPAAPESPDSGLSEGDVDSGLDPEEEEDEGQEDEEEEGEEEEGSEEGTEGSGIDVAKDLSPTSAEPGRTPTGPTPQSSFGGAGASMNASTFSLVSRPDVAHPPRSPLFGGQSRSGVFGTSAPVFQKPAPPSPRSPSPIRSAVPPRMQPGEGSRSFSAPGMASQIPGAPRPKSSGYAKSISTRIQPQEDPNVALQKEAQKKQSQQDQYSLEDDEYEKIQALLDSPVEPSLDIGEFNAFNSVTADAHASTIAAQVEALYRDMNGMLVTLGLNARALTGFIKGHESRTSHRKTKKDLERFDDWVLCEAEDLSDILDDELATELEEGRVQDLDDTWDTCQSLVRELPKLRAKHQDLKRVLSTVLDPDQAAAARSIPLSAEQAAQQNELRQTYARVSKLMADAESALTMLKTKLASAAGAAGKTAAVPTVDAILRTITRMTSAAEKRSGDIDVLESQMRKLRLGSVGPSISREGSPAPFMTPPQNKRQSLILAGSSTHNSFTPSPRRSLNGSASVSRVGMSPRKKISGFTGEEKEGIRDKMQRRQAVLDRLKGKLVEGGPKVSRIGDAK